jgi:hypothetical protein
LDGRFDVVTAIHLLHYLENAAQIESALRRISGLLDDRGRFVTMIANPEFDLAKHDAIDSRTKFGYYFSLAEPGNGGLMRFHPGGFEKERELTVEFRRWQRHFLDRVAAVWRRTEPAFSKTISPIPKASFCVSANDDESQSLRFL